jgi:hypothetical protein
MDQESLKVEEHEGASDEKSDPSSRKYYKGISDFLTAVKQNSED